MKTSLDHLPLRAQGELDKIKDLILDEFDSFIMNATQPWKRRGRILRIILFGSFARGDHVWGHPGYGYQSDYDILVIVNHRRLASYDDIWWSPLEDRMMRLARRPATVIVHSIDFVNDHLAKGQFFFTAIKKEGVLLHDSGTRELADKKVDLSPEERRDIAREHYKMWFPGDGEFMIDANACIKRGNLKKAAFELHQAAESLYNCVLLVLTNYTPSTHNILHLRNLANNVDTRFRDILLEDSRAHKRAVQRLKDAYVKGRYSRHYEVTEDELAWLRGQVEMLRDRVKEACRDRIGTEGL